MELHRCTKLHMSITLAHCEALRKRPQWGGRGGEPGRPPQCNGCEDWMQWDDSNTVQLKHKEDATMPPRNIQGVCAECGETKTLQTKTLCHKCNRKRLKKERAEEIKGKNMGRIALDFGADQDLLRDLTMRAHANYRSLHGEIMVTLRGSTDRPRPADMDEPQKQRGAPR